jgi:predicted Fe-S protein YdhL (DUF1289 family)
VKSAEADKGGEGNLPISPCVKLCKLNNKLCTGCFRTLSEIGQWGKWDMDQRMELMKKLSGQVTTHNCPECGSPTYCAMEAGKSASTCWCMTVERKGSPETDASEQSCLCRKCLSEL